MIDSKKKYLKYILLFGAFILATFVSLYSITDNSWVWETDKYYVKVLGTTSGFVAFTGIWATVSFWKKEGNAYYLAIINAILFGAYALSINLTGDFIINVVWYIPLLIVMFIKNKKNEITPNETLDKKTFFIILGAFVVAYVFFFVCNKYINDIWVKIVGYSNATYGSNFNMYWFGRALDAMMNSISFVAMYMMIKGYKHVWMVWIIKNIVGIIFFSGVGVFSISILVMNSIFLLLSIYIIIKRESENENIYSRSRSSRKNNSN